MNDKVKVVLWGTGGSYNASLSFIKLCEEAGKFEVVGVVTKDKYFKEYDGYPSIDNINNNICDYIICMAPRFYLEIIKEASFFKIPASKIIRVDVLGHAGFTFEKWNRLFESRVSIISRNCWGGQHIIISAFLFYLRLSIW